MNKKDYIAHLRNVGAEKVASNAVYDTYQIGKAVICVTSSRAVCNGKELCIFSEEKVV